jgi:formylglycine-generating enzyme required for sulfatase activity
MVLIPAGPFLMGSNHGKPDEKPRRKVTLDAYYIYKRPVTVGQYRKFCTATKRAMPDEQPRGGWKEDHPITGVSWKDAEAYCQWLSQKVGKPYRLPTEAEWEKAARGTDGVDGKKPPRTYPWGANFEPSRLRCSKAKMGDVGSTAPAGSHLTGASPYGILDMAGNVWNWCADWYMDDYYRAGPEKNPPGPTTGTERVVRGGSWAYYEPTMFRVTVRQKAPPGDHGSDTGFRCVSSRP